MDRLSLARHARGGRAGAHDARGRSRRGHLQPDDLPEGDLARRPLRRADQAAARAGGRSEGDLPPALVARRGSRARPARPRAREDGLRRLCLLGGRPDARVRPRGDVRRGDAPPRLARPSQPVREDPGHEARPWRDRGLRRAREEHQRDADLLPAALRRGGRGVPPRARAPRRRRREPERRSTPSRASSSRASTRRRTSASTRSARRTPSPSVASSQSRTRSLRTSTIGRRSPGRAGSSSPARARIRSAACGRRPRQRTLRTATSSTSRS